MWEPQLLAALIASTACTEINLLYLTAERISKLNHELYELIANWSVATPS
jgi:hypothetical protein